MAAVIVYQGVGGGGDLFQGTKFHLLIRVPTRKQWEGLIEANGGQLVQLEKQADIVIGDHARKDSPVGSISWTYIEQSVKNGKLEDVENHRAGPAAGTVRAVGSTQPARRGRTPFTPEDDRVLMEWCARAERNGASLKGNEIYMQLEARNPRHTFQSWRDHWIKILSSRPRVAISEDAETEIVIHGDTAGPSRSSPRLPRDRSAPSRAAPVPQMAAAKRPRQKPPVERNTIVTPSKSPGQYVVGKPVGGADFTEEENEELLRCYDSIMNLDQDRVIDAWIAWAAEYPNHTAQEWRNHFNNVIRSKGESNTASRHEQDPESPLRGFVNPPIIASSPEAPHQMPVARGSNQKSASAQPRKVQDSLGSSDQGLPSAKGEELRLVDPALTNEAIFKRSLLGLADLLKVEVDLNPVICGQRVSLFRLWQVVMSDEMGGFDHVNGRDKWTQVARSLNFNDYRHSNAAADLRICYSEILADFESIREDFLEAHPDADLTESQEELMIESQLRQTANQNPDETDIQDLSHQPYITTEIGGADDEEHDDDLDFPQSSSAGRAQQTSTKRALEAGHSGSSSSSFKRQRIDKGKGREVEIPSTPEDNTKGKWIRSILKPSPLKQVSPLPQPGNDSPADASPEPATKTSLFKNLKRLSMLEPETQDFRFSEVLDDEESLPEIPPSPLQSKVQARDLSSTNATRGSGPSEVDSSTQSQTESQERRDLQEFYDRHLSLLYSREIILEALTATTMVREDAAFVMEALMTGEGIPDDMPGVWTRQDDKALEESVESKKYRKNLLKHGKKRVQRRKKFLGDLNELDMEGDS